MNQSIIEGDCIEAMREMPENSVDSVVTDPPYGLSKEPDVAEVMRHWLDGDAYEHKSNGFMGRSWDSFVPGPEYWREVYRVMKPGAYLLAFAGTRTWDLLSMAIRLAGFENRDTISHEGPPAQRWYYGSGFPKSANISKMLDRMAGAEREVVGTKVYPDGTKAHAERPGGNEGWQRPWMQDEDARKRVTDVTAAATDAAKQWTGWGSALKPAWEVILMFRKPLDKGSGLAANVLKHGTGAINVDASRIASSGPEPNARENKSHQDVGTTGYNGAWQPQERPWGATGRWPSNLLLSHVGGPDGCQRVGTKRVKGDGAHPANVARRTGEVYGKYAGIADSVRKEMADPDGHEEVADFRCVEGCPVKALDEQSGTLKSGANPTKRSSDKFRSVYHQYKGQRECVAQRGADAGGASRFFQTFEPVKLTGPGFRYQAKASRAERTANSTVENGHPTVKSLALMRYLVRMVTPLGGTVLDCFLGSGTTGVAAVLEGFDFIGIEQDESYAQIARKRIGRASDEQAERLAV